MSNSYPLDKVRTFSSKTLNALVGHNVDFEWHKFSKRVFRAPAKAAPEQQSRAELIADGVTTEHACRMLINAYAVGYIDATKAAERKKTLQA